MEGRGAIFPARTFRAAAKKLLWPVHKGDCTLDSFHKGGGTFDEKDSFISIASGLFLISCAAVPTPSYAQEKANVLVMGEDAGGSSVVPCDSQVFKRLRGALVSQPHSHGYDMFDETAPTLAAFLLESRLVPGFDPESRLGPADRKRLVAALAEALGKGRGRIAAPMAQPGFGERQADGLLARGWRMAPAGGALRSRGVRIPRMGDTGTSWS